MDSISKINGNQKSDCDTVQQSATSGSELAPSLVTSKGNKKNKLKKERGSSQSHSAAAGVKPESANKKYYPRPQQPIHPNVQVCPINVGQGDSILLKLRYEQGMLYPESNKEIA